MSCRLRQARHDSGVQGLAANRHLRLAPATLPRLRWTGVFGHGGGTNSDSWGLGITRKQTSRCASETARIGQASRVAKVIRSPFSMTVRFGRGDGMDMASSAIQLWPGARCPFKWARTRAGRPSPATSTTQSQSMATVAFGPGVRIPTANWELGVPTRDTNPLASDQRMTGRRHHAVDQVSWPGRRTAACGRWEAQLTGLHHCFQVMTGWLWPWDPSTLLPSSQTVLCGYGAARTSKNTAMAENSARYQCW
jgi:hypothetical protein